MVLGDFLLFERQGHGALPAYLERDFGLMLQYEHPKALTAPLPLPLPKPPKSSPTDSEEFLESSDPKNTAPLYSSNTGVVVPEQVKALVRTYRPNYAAGYSVWLLYTRMTTISELASVTDHILSYLPPDQQKPMAKLLLENLGEVPPSSKQFYFLWKMFVTLTSKSPVLTHLRALPEVVVRAAQFPCPFGGDIVRLHRLSEGKLPTVPLTLPRSLAELRDRLLQAEGSE